MTLAFPKPTKGARPKKPKDSKIERVPTSKKPPKHLERDEFELDELAITLKDAKEDGCLRSFVIYRWEEPFKGVVTRLDHNTKLIHIRDEAWNIHKVHFLDILKVSVVKDA